MSSWQELDGIQLKQFSSPFLDQSTLEYEQDVLYALRHRGSFSSASGSSVCEPVSPVSRRLSAMQEPSVANFEDEGEDAPWNLVAYHIPWGPGYEGYQAGTLPGPDGTCIFLRSPTPLKRQRTTQACEKCRERKAKCSGARPTCGRCLDRGLVCYYSAAGDTPPGSVRPSTRRLTPSNSKEQLKASIRNRVRRQSVQHDSDMGDYIDQTHRTRAQSLGAHVGRPGDLVRKASLNSMFDHYQAGLSEFEGGLSLTGCHDDFRPHGQQQSAQGFHPEASQPSETFRFPQTDVSTSASLIAPTPINLAEPHHSYFFHGGPGLDYPTSVGHSWTDMTFPQTSSSGPDPGFQDSFIDTFSTPIEYAPQGLNFQQDTQFLQPLSHMNHTFQSALVLPFNEQDHPHRI